jgi:putative MATE family efflux protein
MDSGQKLMTSGSIPKQMLLFALPIFLGNLFQQLYNTVDSLIVGNYLGSQALAAVSSSGNIIFLMIGFFNGVAIGSGVVISRYFGAHKIDRMQDAIHTTVAFGLIVSIIMTFVGVLFTPTLLRWMSTPENVMPQSITYFKVYFLGSIGSIMYNFFVGILQAVGDSKHSLYFLIVSSIVNIVLDLLFVAVLHMGVGSAALATIISQYISAVLCLYLLMSTKGSHRLYIRKIRIHKDMLEEILKYGLPSGFQNSIIAIANVVVQSNINSFGDMAMAGCGAYSKVEGFAFLPITSFTMALTTFVGQNLGAGNKDRTLKGAKFGMTCSMLLAETIGVFMFIFASPLISAFNNDPSVVEYGRLRAQTSALFFFLLAYSHCVSAILRGAGKSMVPMIVMLICWCAVRVSFLTITGILYHNIWCVYWVYPITWCLSSCVFVIYYHKVKWMN